MLSIVIPALDEAAALPLLLADLQPLRAAGHELIVVDGGSSDRTVELALPLSDRVVSSARGRAAQMNTGAAQSSGSILVFLHADTRIDTRAREALEQLDSGDGWGFFRVCLRGRSKMLPLVAWLMAVRSRWSGIATGDQGLFVSRALFDAVGGFPPQPLMEDIEICRRLRARATPRALPLAIESSGRRWDRDGAIRTILLMWWLRLRYFLGADPRALARVYHRG
jgi:rSAM/selenodomain-associated transferase 2